MEILNATTIVVESFDEFKQYLEEDNDYTLIYLSVDIDMINTVEIFPDREEITIDGQYPPGSDTRHTLIDYKSSSDVDAFGIHSPSEISMTIQNLNIIGHNYHGILFVPSGYPYHKVQVNYRNIKYSGPQMTYNPTGITRYFDCEFISAEGTSSVQEVGEVGRVEIGGCCTFLHAADPLQNNAVFRFWESSINNSLTILPGSEVTISTENGLIACRADNQIAFNINAGASLEIESAGAMNLESNDIFSSITVEEGANLQITQTEPSLVPTIQCGSFTVGAGTHVRIVADYDNTLSLIQFIAGGSLSLNSPKRFVLYNRIANAMGFSGSTPVLIRGGQVNRWAVAKTPYLSAGGLNNMPSSAWRKPDGSFASIDATVGIDGSTSIDDNNFSEDDMKDLPPLTDLQFKATKVFSVGELPIALDPIVSGGRPITGTTAPLAALYATYTFESLREAWGTSSESGKLSLDTPTSIPEGAQVSVTSNLAFLYSTVKALTLNPGELALLAPRYIPFLIEAISIDPVLYGRQAPDFHVTVSDTRVYSDAWYLYCNLEDPMIGEKSGRPIPGTLVFADSADVLHTLDETYTLVYTGTKDEANPPKDISWAADKGLLLRATGEPFYKNETYQARITWTLSDVPLP